MCTLEYRTSLDSFSKNKLFYLLFLSCSLSLFLNIVFFYTYIYVYFFVTFFAKIVWATWPSINSAIILHFYKHSTTIYCLFTISRSPRLIIFQKAQSVLCLFSDFFHIFAFFLFLVWFVLFLSCFFLEPFFFKIGIVLKSVKRCALNDDRRKQRPSRRPTRTATSHDTYSSRAVFICKRFALFHIEVSLLRTSTLNRPIFQSK